MRTTMFAAAAALVLGVTPALASNPFDVFNKPVAIGGKQTCGSEIKLKSAPKEFKEIVILLDPEGLVDPQRGNPTDVIVQFVAAPEKFENDPQGHLLSKKKCTYSSGTVATDLRVAIQQVSVNGKSMLGTRIPVAPEVIAQRAVGTTLLRGLDNQKHHYDAHWGEFKEAGVTLVVFKRKANEKAASK